MGEGGWVGRLGGWVGGGEGREQNEPGPSLRRYKTVTRHPVVKLEVKPVDAARVVVANNTVFR